MSNQLDVGDRAILNFLLLKEQNGTLTAAEAARLNALKLKAVPVPQQRPAGNGEPMLMTHPPRDPQQIPADSPIFERPGRPAPPPPPKDPITIGLLSPDVLKVLASIDGRMRG